MIVYWIFACAVLLLGGALMFLVATSGRPRCKCSHLGAAHRPRCRFCGCERMRRRLIGA